MSLLFNFINFNKLFTTKPLSLCDLTKFIIISFGEKVKSWCVAAISLLVIIKIVLVMIGTIDGALHNCDNFIYMFHISC